MEENVRPCAQSKHDYICCLCWSLDRLLRFVTGLKPVIAMWPGDCWLSAQTLGDVKTRKLVSIIKGKGFQKSSNTTLFFLVKPDFLVSWSREPLTLFYQGFVCKCMTMALYPKLQEKKKSSQSPANTKTCRGVASYLSNTWKKCNTLIQNYDRRERRSLVTDLVHVNAKFKIIRWMQCTCKCSSTPCFNLVTPNNLVSFLHVNIVNVVWCLRHGSQWSGSDWSVEFHLALDRNSVVAWDDLDSKNGLVK